MTLTADEVIKRWTERHNTHQRFFNWKGLASLVLIVVVIPGIIVGFHYDTTCIMVLLLLGMLLTDLITHRYWQAQAATAAGHRKAVIAFMLSNLTYQVVLAFLGLWTVTLDLLSASSAGYKFVALYAPLLVTVLFSVIFPRQLIPYVEVDVRRQQKGLAPLIFIASMLPICGAGLGILVGRGREQGINLFSIIMLMIGYGCVSSAILVVYELVIVLRDRTLESPA